MNLDTAIWVAKDILWHVKSGDPPEEHDALKLLIEAGNAIKQAREGSWASFKDLLPGETEE